MEVCPRWVEKHLHIRDGAGSDALLKGRQDCILYEYITVKYLFSSITQHTPTLLLYTKRKFSPRSHYLRRRSISSPPFVYTLRRLRIRGFPSVNMPDAVRKVDVCRLTPGFSPTVTVARRSVKTVSSPPPVTHTSAPHPSLVSPRGWNLEHDAQNGIREKKKDSVMGRKIDKKGNIYLLLIGCRCTLRTLGISVGG